MGKFICIRRCFNGVTVEKWSIASRITYIYGYYYRTYEKAVSGGGEREKGSHLMHMTSDSGLQIIFQNDIFGLTSPMFNRWYKTNFKHCHQRVKV